MDEVKSVEDVSAAKPAPREGILLYLFVEGNEADSPHYSAEGEESPFGIRGCNSPSVPAWFPSIKATRVSKKLDYPF